jgi:hypothetical protein
MGTPASNSTGVDDVALGFCNAGVPADPPRDVAQLNVVLINNPDTTNVLHARDIVYTVFTSSLRQWVPGQPPSLWMPAMSIPTALPYTDRLYMGISVAERPFLP